MKRLPINKDARTRTPSESRRGACADHRSEILLSDDTAAAPGAELAAVKEINRGSNPRQRQLSIGLKDVPPFMTDSSIPLPAQRAVGNRRQNRFSPESIGSSGSVDQPAGPAALDESLLLDSREVERLLGIGRTKVYELIASAQIPVVRIGRCVRIPRDELRTWVEQRTAPSTPPDAWRQDS